MRNLSNTRLTLAATAVLAFATVVSPATPAASQAPPQVPATFYGSVHIDGKPAPEGTVVRGFVAGRDCTQADASPTIVEEGVARFVIAVVHETHVAGCGREGIEVTFTIDGAPASPATTWTGGPREVNISSGPPPSPSPAAAATTAAPSRSPVTSPGVNPDEGGPDSDVVRFTILGVAAAVAIAGVAVLVGRKFKGKA